MNMTNKKDSDILALKMACKAIENTSKRMHKATIEFLWDKYVISTFRKSSSYQLDYKITSLKKE
jgi:hypothetical protein